MQKFRYLSKDDEIAVSKFIEHYSSHFFSIPSNPIYHYTSGDNFINIIKKGELWATQAACLNDTTEITYAINCLLERVEVKLQSGGNDKNYYILQRMKESLSSPNIETSPVFVSCFSESQDDLSQWRAYSGHEGGYALEFDASKLRDCGYSIDAEGKLTPKILLARIEYDLNRHSMIFDNVIDFSVKFFNELSGSEKAKALNEVESWADEFCTYWLNNLAIFAACIKNPAFSSEREWRLIYYFGPNDPARMEFRQKQSMMTRHIPLDLQKPLPIMGVIVGPCRHPQLSKVAAADLLLANEFDLASINIRLTQIPYRIT